tara:strand:- start:296 stop:508 length:213 start_codon:yes stop_codon:yes gene_type:complete
MKKPKLKKDHDIQKVNEDLSDILNIIENLNSLDSNDKLKIEDIEKEIEEINKNLESKYKKFEEENLDSEE